MIIGLIVPSPSGYNITVMATPCDGIIECLHGIDEANCDNNLETVALSNSIAFLVSILVSGKALYFLSSIDDLTNLLSKGW